MYLNIQVIGAHGLFHGVALCLGIINERMSDEVVGNTGTGSYSTP